MAVAALKPFPLGGGIVRRKEVLHGLMAVAALKHQNRPVMYGYDVDVLHGLMAVAALKPQRTRTSAPGPFPVLHGLMAVAALKRRMPAWPACWSRVLHGLMAVAALKHSGGRFYPLDPRPFSTASWPWPH